MAFPRMEAGIPKADDLLLQQDNNPLDSDLQADTKSDNPFETLVHLPSSRIKQVWALGSGKGGVGKSLIASSLSIALSRLGNKVVALDLDLGGANFHTALGVEIPRKTLGDFLSGRVRDLNDCVAPTGIPNVQIISGANDSVGIAELSHQQEVNLLKNIQELDADYVVIDLGAGTSNYTLDFFLYADLGLITMVPEPTSIENAYRFIKAVYYRRLKLSERLSKIRPLIQMAMDIKNPLGIKTPSDLLREVSRSDPESAILLKEARTQTDVDIGFSVKSVCKKYFGIEVDYIGYLDYDSSVWQSIRRKKPLLLEFPNSRIVTSIERISSYLVKRHGHIRSTMF
jgi:flagellar biosynthesis protein FlhG